MQGDNQACRATRRITTIRRAIARASCAVLAIGILAGFALTAPSCTLPGDQRLAEIRTELSETGSRIETLREALDQRQAEADLATKQLEEAVLTGNQELVDRQTRQAEAVLEQLERTRELAVEADAEQTKLLQERSEIHSERADAAASDAEAIGELGAMVPGPAGAVFGLAGAAAAQFFRLRANRREADAVRYRSVAQRVTVGARDMVQSFQIAKSNGGREHWNRLKGHMPQASREAERLVQTIRGRNTDTEIEAFLDTRSSTS